MTTVGRERERERGRGIRRSPRRLRGGEGWGAGEGIAKENPSFASLAEL